MDRLIAVGLGGALGAMCRYAVSLIPWKGGFPLLTLATNLAGALLIGVVTGMAEGRGTVKPNTLLFLKTGVCGGFTTFSTFSLEALTLMERGHRLYAALYVILSVAGCVLGVWLGRRAGSRIWLPTI